MTTVFFFIQISSGVRRMRRTGQTAPTIARATQPAIGARA